MKRSVNPGWRAVQEGAAYLTRHAKTVASLVLSMRLSTPAGQRQCAVQPRAHVRRRAGRPQGFRPRAHVVQHRGGQWGRNRQEWQDNLERDMTRAEISRATELARACMASGYQDCEPARSTR